MAYAFEHEETAHAGVLRVMNEQIARARGQLTDEKLPVGKRVHEARKRFKETRALVRLVRKPLGDSFAIENAWFRDAGRDLAGARDAEAVLESLEKLAAHARIPAGTLKKARRTLEAQRDAVDATDLQGRVANVTAQFDAAMTRLAAWPELGRSFGAIADGLLRTYAGGRKEMRAALRARDAEALHEWRKRVKEHWYHVQLLRAVWPPMMKAYAGVLEELSHALGDHHDLHVLHEIAASEELGEKLLAAIDARQRELEQQAEELGRRVYAESPEAWLARMRNYWRAWRAR
ncbi:MAG TPA: CHAD domain-containing protein [Thermoanaerobaculia bacterium]|nr:CHAD domain-containing protein [Thermoanaerobaculia bacterium]